jgi:hypothetical protein
MVKCSSEVIAHNGFRDSINIIPKRSTDITVGPNKDMEQRANVLITEVFDTELIGEGAIGTFNHANQHLLTVTMKQFWLNSCVVLISNLTFFRKILLLYLLELLFMYS